MIRRGRKFGKVLNGARDVFMAAGYEGASVDEIARAAGVSKATLYNYFPDKRLLFSEVVRVECLRQADEAAELIDRGEAPTLVLTAAARRIVDFYTSDFGAGVHRICVGEAGRFPELGARFYESGPLLVRNRLVEYLQEATQAGKLTIEEYELAADQFVKLCEASLFDRVITGVQTAFTEDETSRVIDAAIMMFLARYGAMEDPRGEDASALGA